MNPDATSTGRSFVRSFSAMGCPCQVRMDCDEPGKSSAARAAREEVDRLDRKYSHYLNDNFLARLQRAASAAEGVPVDDETAALLDHAFNQHEASDGLFDITTGRLTTLWDRPSSLPTDRQISDALEHCGMHRLAWNRPVLHVPQGVRIDFGGLVKEYAADRAALILRERGIRSACVDLGGDLHLLGPHHDGSAWRVGIRDPGTGESAIGQIEVESGGLATSGDYERFSELEGRRYGHIINPTTGYPVSSFRSVSVLAPTTLLAGSMATMAMLAGVVAGTRLLQEGGLPWLAVQREGTVTGTLA